MKKRGKHFAREERNLCLLQAGCGIIFGLGVSRHFEKRPIV